MKRKQIVLLFLFLSVISLIWLVANGEANPDDSNEEKIKEAINSGIKNVSDEAKKNGSVAVGKIKEAASNFYQLAQDGSGELLQSYVLSPAENVIEKCIEKAVSVGISVLPDEKVKHIIETTVENSCECP